LKLLYLSCRSTGNKLLWVTDLGYWIFGYLSSPLHTTINRLSRDDLSRRCCACCHGDSTCILSLLLSSKVYVSSTPSRFTAGSSSSSVSRNSGCCTSHLSNVLRTQRSICVSAWCHLDNVRRSEGSQRFRTGPSSPTRGRSRYSPPRKCSGM